MSDIPVLFIREQMALFKELKEEFQNEDEALDRHIWSPISCRWCCWTHEANYGGKLLW